MTQASLDRVVRDGADGTALVAVRAKPRASRSKVVGLVTEPDGAVALDVAVAAPPVDGAANAEIVAFLAGVLGVPRRAVRVVRGEASRHKVLAVDASPAAVLARLAELV